MPEPVLGTASPVESPLLDQRIKPAKLHVLLLGMSAYDPEKTKSIRNYVEETQ